MKDAVRTSVLSHQWEKLWAFIPCLNFDASKTSDELQLGNKSLEIERPPYVSWVNQVVKSHRGPTIDEFRVRFDLDKSFRFDIDRWVNFAMEKRVKKFELDLSDYRGFAQNKLYTFPHMSHTVKHLRSRPLDFSSCNSLRVLKLKCVNVTGKVLEYFLSNCPFLEQLCVSGSDRLVNLKVAGPSLRLKYLEIEYCSLLKNIEISATNLVSFKYFGAIISLPCQNIPQLVEISIGGEYCQSLNHIRQLSNNFSRLEKLTLHNLRTEESMAFLEFPTLCKLKQLELMVWARDDDTLLGFSSLIKACPNLYRFALELHWIQPLMRRKPQRARRCSHQYLKVVELVGFVGRTIDVELAMYFIENAISLEKIVFDTRNPAFQGSPWELTETKKRRGARKRAEQLGRKLCPGADIVIL